MKRKRNPQRKRMEMNKMNSQEIIQILKLFQVDSLIRILTLYYLFKVCNIAVLLINNGIETIANIWESFKGK